MASYSQLSDPLARSQRAFHLRLCTELTLVVLAVAVTACGAVARGTKEPEATSPSAQPTSATIRSSPNKMPDSVDAPAASAGHDMTPSGAPSPSAPAAKVPVTSAATPVASGSGAAGSAASGAAGTASSTGASGTGGVAGGAADMAAGSVAVPVSPLSSDGELCTREEALVSCDRASCAFTADEIDCVAACKHLAAICTTSCDACLGMTFEPASCRTQCALAKGLVCTNRILGCAVNNDTCESGMACIAAHR